MNDIEAIVLFILAGAGAVIWFVGLVIVSLVEKVENPECICFGTRPDNDEVRAVLQCEQCPYELKCKLKTKERADRRPG